MTEQEYKDQIYSKANKVETKSELDQLLQEIMEYQHDYGSIVYGCMAAMLGAFKLVNRSSVGGITGFQAGCLGWECIREFMCINGPARLMDYDNLLYPQYADKFEKTISPDTWSHIQDEAKKNLAAATEHVSERVKEHWSQIIAGRLPFGFVVKDE